MLIENKIVDGSAVMTCYDFENVGDELPAHTHDAATVHYSIVANGVLKMVGKDQPEQVLPCGSMIRIEAGIDHGFVAMTPRARLVNVVYGRAA